MSWIFYGSWPQKSWYLAVPFCNIMPSNYKNITFLAGPYPVSTRRRFNVVTTLLTSTTTPWWMLLCVSLYWISGLFFNASDFWWLNWYFIINKKKLTCFQLLHSSSWVEWTTNCPSSKWYVNSIYLLNIFVAFFKFFCFLVWIIIWFNLLIESFRTFFILGHRYLEGINNLFICHLRTQHHFNVHATSS